MPRIQPVDYESAPAHTRALHDETVRNHGRVTNMKATLLHSPPAIPRKSLDSHCIPTPLVGLITRRLGVQIFK